MEWISANGCCKDCGGDVIYINSLKMLVCDSCENEQEGVM